MPIETLNTIQLFPALRAALMNDAVALQYRAFIAYSHADAGWAKWLHRWLESFRGDKDLIGRDAAGTIHKTLRPIYRDPGDLTVGQRRCS